MRIGIDMRMAGTGEGIGRYVEELAYNIALSDQGNEYYFIFDKNFQINEDSRLLNSNFRNAHIVRVTSKYYSFAEQTWFIWELLRLRLDLMHFTSFNAPIFYPKKFVVTIHDIIHHDFPGRKKSHFLHRLAYRLAFYSSIRNATKIIAVSENTKQDIINTFRVSPDKIIVIYEGVTENFSKKYQPETENQLLAKYGIKTPYLLFVGVWRQYKNHVRLARAFDIIKEQYQDITLVLAGKIDLFYPEIKRDVFSIKHKADVKALGFVPYDDLPVLYRLASVFVIPSLMEGFGLIGIEAQASGVPIVASDIPVLNEVLGHGAIFFDPKNESDIAEKILMILGDEQARNKLISLGKINVLKYNWRKTAIQTLQVYKSV